MAIFKDKLDKVRLTDLADQLGVPPLDAKVDPNEVVEQYAPKPKMLLAQQLENVRLEVEEANNRVMSSAEEFFLTSGNETVAALRLKAERLREMAESYDRAAIDMEHNVKLACESVRFYIEDLEAVNKTIHQQRRRITNTSQ